VFGSQENLLGLQGEYRTKRKARDDSDITHAHIWGLRKFHS